VIDWAQRFIERVLRENQPWPLKSERDVVRQLKAWIAMRESDREALRQVAGWPWDPREREYHVDPLPEQLGRAFADLLFGEDPSIEPAAPGDQKRLEAIVEENELSDELHWGEQICFSEGEVWLRTFSDPEIADVPLLEVHSRLAVLPLFAGRVLKAAAIVSELEGPDAKGVETAVYRHFELHVEGRVENVLYRGRKDNLGSRVDLGAHEETAGMIEVWSHDLPGMLLERIPHRRGRNRRLGTSGFDGIKDTLLDLNEAVTIGAENARLTLKKRVVVPEGSVQAPEREELVDRGDGSMQPIAGKFDTAEDVLVASALDRELGRSSDVFKVLEYSFDADAHLAWEKHLVERGSSRVGLTVAYLGVDQGEQGTAQTGTALRMRLIPTTSAARGVARPWKMRLPRVLTLMQALDGSRPQFGGFGRPWEDALDPPSVELTDPLPEDPVEEDARHAANVSAGIESIERSIRDRHPDWDDKQVEDELEKIRADKKASRPVSMFTPDEEPDEDDDEDDNVPPTPAPEPPNPTG